MHFKLYKEAWERVVRSRIQHKYELNAKPTEIISGFGRTYTKIWLWPNFSANKINGIDHFEPVYAIIKQKR